MNRFLIILPAVDRDRANAVAAEQFDTAGGARTFFVGISASGQVPATHYWCSAVFSDVNATKLALAQADFPLAVVQGYDADNDAGFPQRKLIELGLKQIVTLPEGI
ncbi:MAG: hypothetical protein ACXWBP_09065 [Limisphaerales bacterium]